MRLVDADLPRGRMESLYEHHLEMRNFSADGAVYDCLEILDEAPTVDAVPVVRCKDCVYWQSGENEAEKWEYCRRHHIDIGPHSFCSHGERRSE